MAKSRQPGTLLPFVTPGYSDNRFFRNKGILTLGFFPLDAKNSIAGIHGPGEYINRNSLRLALDILPKAVKRFAGLA